MRVRYAAVFRICTIGMLFLMAWHKLVRYPMEMQDFWAAIRISSALMNAACYVVFSFLCALAFGRGTGITLIAVSVLLIPIQLVVHFGFPSIYTLLIAAAASCIGMVAGRVLVNKTRIGAWLKTSGVRVKIKASKIC